MPVRLHRAREAKADRRADFWRGEAAEVGPHDGRDDGVAAWWSDGSGPRTIGPPAAGASIAPATIGIEAPPSASARGIGGLFRRAPVRSLAAASVKGWDVSTSSAPAANRARSGPAITRIGAASSSAGASMRAPRSPAGAPRSDRRAQRPPLVPTEARDEERRAAAEDERHVEPPFDRDVAHAVRRVRGDLEARPFLEAHGAAAVVGQRHRAAVRDQRDRAEHLIPAASGAFPTAALANARSSGTSAPPGGTPSCTVPRAAEVLHRGEPRDGGDRDLRSRHRLEAHAIAEGERGPVRRGERREVARGPDEVPPARRRERIDPGVRRRDPDRAGHDPRRGTERRGRTSAGSSGPRYAKPGRNPIILTSYVVAA